jgi:hypothetical protein
MDVFSAKKKGAETKTLRLKNERFCVNFQSFFETMICFLVKFDALNLLVLLVFDNFDFLSCTQRCRANSTRSARVRARRIGSRRMKFPRCGLDLRLVLCAWLKFQRFSKIFCNCLRTARAVTAFSLLCRNVSISIYVFGFHSYMPFEIYRAR